MATDHELRGNWELKTDVVYAKYENYDVSSKGIKKTYQVCFLINEKCDVSSIHVVFLRISCTTIEMRILQVSLQSLYKF